MLVSLVGIIILKVFKVDVDRQTIMEFVILISSYMLAQGWADSGKEAAKIEAVAAMADKGIPSAVEAARQIAKDMKA